MRIGVDATCWMQRRGYGRHLRGLINAACALESGHEFVLFTDFEGASPFPFPVSAEIIGVDTARQTIDAAAAEKARSLGDMWSMGNAMSAARLDVILFPTIYSWVPTWTSTPKVLMIHDVIAERFPSSVFPDAAGRMRWNLKSLLGRAQADRVVTVSEYSRRMLAAQFGMDIDSIAVVGEAPDPIFRVLDDAVLPEKISVPPDACTLTYVGGFGPHKNVGRLIEAFATIAEDQNGVLVLAGDFEGDAFHSEFHELSRRAAQAKIESRVVFTGFLEDEDLVRLLNRSAVLALPSLMEGYGLPAVEAAACGVPVIVTRESPIPELLGEGALAIDPANVHDLREAMLKLLRDPALRTRVGDAALRAARTLTWEKAARELIGVLEDCRS